MRSEEEAFEIAVTKTIHKEGAPNTEDGDRGGTTVYGISQAFLSRISGGPVSSGHVLGLSLKDAKDIYRLYFWLQPRIHKLHDDALREAVFDQGVNRGPENSVKSLQKAYSALSKRNLAIDGILGPKTLEAVTTVDAAAMLKQFVKESQIAYARIVQVNQSQAKFLVGWLNRTWTYI